MKKLLIALSLIVYLFGLVYLTLPSPSMPILSESARSDEPGDTWQHPDQSAYYTQKERAEVISELEDKFALRFLGIKLPSLRLNHRPEDTKPFVREQIPSNYLEEVVHPFRESLFISGWEPVNAPQYNSIPKESIPKIMFRNKFYFSKVTQKPVYSNSFNRVLIWTLIFPLSYLTLTSLKKAFPKK